MADNLKRKDQTFWNEVRKLKISIDQKPNDSLNSITKKSPLKIQTTIAENYEIHDENSNKTKDILKDKEFEQAIQKLQRLRRHNDLNSNRMFYSEVSNQAQTPVEPLRTCEDKKLYEEYGSPFSAVGNISIKEQGTMKDTGQLNEQWKISFLEGVLKEFHISVDYDKKNWKQEENSDSKNKKAIMELKKQIKQMERSKEKEIKEIQEKHKEDTESIKAEYESKINEISKENELINSENQQEEIDSLKKQLEEYTSEIEKLRSFVTSPGKGTSMNIRTANIEKLDEIVKCLSE